MTINKDRPPQKDITVTYVMLLTCGILILDITKIIDYPWYKILSPIWAYFIMVIFIGIKHFITSWWYNKKRK